MGGGPVYGMNQFVWGIDLVEEQFLGACGIPSRPYLSKIPQKCIAEFSVNAQKTGTLQNADWCDVSAFPSLTVAEPLATVECNLGFAQSARAF